jgi:hypothetical protein
MSLMDLDRLADKFTIDDGCWEWTGGITSRGYGAFWQDGHTLSAHRMIYELLIGPIPDGLTIDHLCRNRACVNPSHLETVTMRENIRRSPTVRKTHCAQGHKLVGKNLGRQGPNGRWRACAECNRIAARNRMRRLRTRIV